MIREPYVDGRFYPADPYELSQTIEDCWQHELGAKKADIKPSGKLLGFIQPHAGFIFSGPVATWGIKRLSLENPLPQNLILLGPKHTYLGAVAAVSRADEWLTPLGRVKVNREWCDELVATGEFQADDKAHEREHSLEVQLPFLQKLYGQTLFKIVPIAFQYSSYQDCVRWGTALGKFLEKHRADSPVCLVSSDFSHETPRNEAYALDSEALDIIEKGDGKAFYDLVISEDRSICGLMPITVFLEAMKLFPVKIRRLKYATSMDIMPHPRGVGYASVICEESK